MNKIIKEADPWQLFLMFSFAIIFYSIPDDEGIMKIIATMIFAFIIFGWLLFLGIELNGNLKEDQQKHDALFIGNCIFVISFIALNSIINADILNELGPLLIGLAMYFSFSIFYIIYFVSTLFYRNQEEKLSEKEKLSPEAIFVLFIGFVFGIIILQPRIKKFFY